MIHFIKLDTFIFKSITSIITDVTKYYYIGNGVNTMNKKSILLLIVLSLLISMLSACGQNTADGVNMSKDNTTLEASNGSTEAAVASEDVEKEPVTLTIWKPQKEADEFTEAQEQKFLDEHPWITLNNVYHDAEGSQDLMIAVAAGTAPACIEISYPQMYRYMYADVLMPLDDYFANWDDYANIDPSMVEFWNYNGSHYGLPRSQYVMGLYYNRAILKEANVQPPTNWDELVETAKLLTVPEKQQYGFGLLISQWTEWWFEYFVWQAGGDLTKKNADGSLTATFTDPAVVKAAEFYRTLLQEKCLQSDLTIDYNTLAADFAAGKAAMTLGGSDAASWYVSMGMKPEDMGFAPMITGPSGNGPSQVGGGVYVIPKTNDQAIADAAFEYISFFSSKDYMTGLIQNQESKGAVAVKQLARLDVKIADVATIDPEFQATVDSMQGNTQLEFYGKAVLGGVLDNAIQKSFFALDSDILQNFQEAQDEANKTIIPDFNEAVSGTN